MMVAGFIAGFPWFTVPAMPWYGLLLVAVMGLGCGWACCGDCTICADTWAGVADGTDVSTGTNCGWTETAGSWSVVGETVTVASADAVLLSNTPQPDGTAEQSITVSLKSSTDGDLIRVLVAYVDADNYHFAEVKVGASGYLRLYRRLAGTNTLLQAFDTPLFVAGTFQAIVVCLTDQQTRITAYIEGLRSTTQITAALLVRNDAAQFGLATGGTVTGTISFDGFTARSTKDTCPDCSLPPEECIICQDDFNRLVL